jgi:HAD superfamily hydrolase (TIGR01509 family)
MRFPCVIFDCDGVLVDSERLVSAIEAQFLTDAGWPMSAEDARRLFKGRTFAAMTDDIEARLQGRLQADWQYQLGFATCAGLARELETVPGVREVVRALAGQHVKLAVASQSPPVRVALSLAVCELDAMFGAHVYTASMVERPKPAPDLYLLAARMLCADPANCAVVEDTPSGVRAARAAGMTVFGYAADEDARALAEAGARVFHRMDQLPSLLENPGVAHAPQ